MKRILELDNKLFLIIYNNTKKYSPIFQKITDLSKPFFIVIYGLLLGFLYFSKDENFYKALFAPLVTLLICRILRYTINRKRPYLIFPYLNLQKKEEASFPSNHSASSLIIALTFLFANSQLAFCLITIAILVAISRIIIGIHFPLDIIFGLLISLLVFLVL